MRIHTSAELKEIDRLATTKLGLPTLVLMENAGRAVAEAARGLLGQAGRVYVVCGKGNNGGDGFCAARQLASARVPTFALTLAWIDEMKGDALVNARAAMACGVSTTGSLAEAGKGDVVVDALFGTGLSRALEGRALELVGEISKARGRGAKIVAVDLPSGLDADKPVPPGAHVRADLTVTLHAHKAATVQFPARAACGELRVASLGIPADDGPGPVRRLFDRDRARTMIARRAADAHKGTAGHVLVVAGSPGKSGAAMMAARAALRAGAGLVTLASGPEVLDRVLPALPEVMGLALPALTGDALASALAGRDALVIGPGLEPSAPLAAALAATLRRSLVPSVVDADALNSLAMSPGALGELFGALTRPILTPHPAELARLLGVSTSEVQADRFLAATEAAVRWNALVVLKGAGTVVATPDGALDVSLSGTPAMATAGSGDVLAGVVGALAAQQLPPGAAASLGVYVHGRAGELAAGGRDRGLLAMEIADALPAAIAELV